MELPNKPSHRESVVATGNDNHEEVLYYGHKGGLLEIKTMLLEKNNQNDSIEMIDFLQKLGIEYHFRKEIDECIASLYKSWLHDANGSHAHESIDFAVLPLLFRLFREYRYPISSDVFCRFLDDDGEFKSSLAGDIHGLLRFYEASYMNTGEEILFKANEFCSLHLKNSLEFLEPEVAKLVEDTLEHPYHLSLQRYKVRHYLENEGAFDIDTRNANLQELARMDFNFVQSVHQTEIQELTRWWKMTGLPKQLPLIRDQMLKWYTWTMTSLPDPKFSYCRIALTKVIAFVYVLDDIFDLYGSVEHLSLFNDAIKRWDLSMIESLPVHMRLCYFTLYNIVVDMSDSFLLKHGWNPINSFRNQWMSLCDAFLVETKWFTSKHVPSTNEYIKNGFTSSGAYVVLVHLYFLLGENVTQEVVELVENNPTLMVCIAKLLRLWDDLGTNKDENQDGFDGSYVECFMKENPNCSLEDSREQIIHMIRQTWEKLNEECFKPSCLSHTYVTTCLNLARMVRVMYSYNEKKMLPLLENHIKALLFKSV